MHWDNVVVVVVGVAREPRRSLGNFMVMICIPAAKDGCRRALAVGVSRDWI